jgi:hypothetical protein
VRQLFATELRRLLEIGLIGALAHGLVLALSAALGGFPFVVAAIGYSAAGFLLGLYQVATWRRGELWTFLIHRPVAPGRLFLALAGAATAVLALIVLLPLLVAGAMEAVGIAGLGPRHLLVAPFQWGTALAFYLAGVVVALRPWRGALLAASPALLAVSLAVPGELGLSVFVPLAVVVAWLTWLGAAATRRDLSSPPRGTAITAITLIPTCYLLFLMASFAVSFAYSLSVVLAEEGWRGASRFSWNAYFAPGTHEHAGYLPGPDLLAHGLRLGQPGDVGALAGAVPDASVAEISPRWRRFPHRHQPTFLDQLAGFQSAAGVEWRFRHDRGELLGQDRRSGAVVGALDAAGEPFVEVPYLAAHRQVVTPRALYWLPPGQGPLVRRLELRSGERFVAPVATEYEPASHLALTDRFVYVFAADALFSPGPEPKPLAAVALPGAIADLERATVGELRDGWLVSFLFGAHAERDLGPARQVVVHVHRDGTSRVLADAPLASGLPTWMRHRGAVVSPALQLLDDALRSTLWGAGRRAARPRDTLAHPPPPHVFALAFSLAALAAGVTWLLSRRRDLDRAARRAWIAAAFLLGPPVPIALLLFAPRSS